MLPTLFLSHGSPMHALHAGRAGAAWAGLGRRLSRPRALLVASAHWETESPLLTTSSRPETIHDFGGFPRELYALRFPAPGAGTLARRAIELLRGAGFAAGGDADRGLDHGAWVPLLHMFPNADVPVAQISLQTTLGAAHHLELGRALGSLAHEDVLVVGSGHLTHNLGEWARHVRRHGPTPQDAPAEPYVDAFRRWTDAQLVAGDGAALARWKEEAPEAGRAHPTDEHFLPLPFAFGAAGPLPRVERIDAGVDAGVLAMDAYLFWPRG